MVIVCPDKEIFDKDMIGVMKFGSMVTKHVFVNWTEKMRSAIVW